MLYMYYIIVRSDTLQQIMGARDLYGGRSVDQQLLFLCLNGGTNGYTGTLKH